MKLELKIPEGYRIVKREEDILENDLFANPFTMMWMPSTISGRPRSDYNVYVYIRKL